MAVVTARVYGQSLISLWSGQLNFVSGTVKAMLVSSSYVPNQDVHRFKSDVSGESAGTGYTAGGLTITGKTMTYTSGTNTLALDCDDLVWGAATVQARYLVFYVSTGSDATSPLISYVDFGADVTSTGGAFTATIPAAGFAQFVAA